MRISLPLVIVLTVSFGAGCGRENAAAPPPAPAQASAPLAPKPDEDILAKIHFAGTTQLLADKKAASNLNAIAELPETAELRNQVLQKLATAPYRFLDQEQKLPGNATDEAALIRPLLEDLIPNESYLELRGPTNTVPDLLLAVHLGNERASLWQTNISAVLEAWTGITVSNLETEGYPGWELKKHHPPNLVRFVRAGDWAVFAWGQDQIAALPALLQRIKAEARPAAVMQEHWLEAWADWPRLLRRDSMGSMPFKLPSMQLALGLKDDSVRTKAMFEFPEPLKLTLTEWNFPTNLMHNPMVSFTAMRGIAPWLNQIQFFKQLQLNPAPNQFCAWAMFGIPFETCVALPVSNATNFVQEVGSRLISQQNTNLEAEGLGHLDWDDTHTTLKLVGIVPLVAPYLTAVPSTNGDFALMGLFPNASQTKPVPAGLFAQMVGHTNQVYYDWEITGERVTQWWNMIMLRRMFTGEVVAGTNAPASKWISAISRKAGNSATEVTLTAPNELTMVRKSPLGLTGLELAWFLSLEGAPGFPLNGDYPRTGGQPSASNGVPSRPATPPTAVKPAPVPPN